MKPYIAIVITLIAITLTTLWIIQSDQTWAENIKLQSTRIWSFFTIKNNPLLPNFDKDLTETDYANSGKDPRVELKNLIGGGPPKDGIPSIDNPKFAPISETEFSDEELIIGVEINGQAKAYPYAILNWHEIVNDTLAGTPIAVTYCPLCETNNVFVREIDIEGSKEEVTFGVSGKLFQSCLVMFDRTTDSLYSQVWGLGVVGSQTNEVLERIPTIRTTIGEWRERHPNSQILTTDTGFRRDYSRYPYGSYYTDDSIIFPVRNQEKRQHDVKTITQIIFDHDTASQPTDYFAGSHQAFTQEEVKAAGEISFNYPKDSSNKYKAVWYNQLNTIEFRDQNGKEVPNMALFNFVLPAYFD